MNDSFQYGDIIFLGIVAAFVLFRLRAMLGRNSGLDPREMWKNAARNVSQVKNVPFSDRLSKKVSEEDIVPQQLQGNQMVSAGLKAIKAVDASFSTSDFLVGAKIAFEWVLEAFSKGDKDKLRMVLSEERFKHFSDEIDAHKNEDARRETTLVSVLATDITEVFLKGNMASVTIQFTTEQINIMRDKDNKVVGGDPSQIEKAIDVWTFERDVSSRDPNWKIVAT